MVKDWIIMCQNIEANNLLQLKTSQNTEKVGKVFL